jgi:hypothetical protein
MLAAAQLFAGQERPSQSNSAPASADSTAQATASTSSPTTKESVAATDYRPGFGTIIVTELENSVGAKKAKIGDRVECTVVQDLLFQGKIVIPRNAKVVGHVTEAEASTKEHRESRLGLTFEKIVLKDKKELLFQGPAIVVALAPPVSQTVKPTTDMRDMPVQMANGGASPGSGSSTGASVLGTIQASPNVLGGNMASSGAAISGANRGVIGWPGLFLLKGAPGTSVIASPKENVELGFRAQMVLRVMEPDK